MTQTAALFLDAYRELNAKKLFWISLVLSGLVVLAFACLGINENGITLLFWDTPMDFVTSELIPPELFYKSMFTAFGIQFWLAWLTTILALISTAGLFPDLIGSGSIDLLLSKPITRGRLFLTKFVTGMMFSGLQVTVFTVACFFVIGLRGGAWEPALFLAIPLIVIFYSYLFSICVLLGLLTRSTIAALLVTLLIWFAVFLIHSGESWYVFRVTAAEHEVASIQVDVDRAERMMAESEEPTEFLTQRTADLRQQLAKAQGKLDGHEKWHGLLYGSMTVLPKTSETIGLLERWLIELAELPDTSDDSSDAELQAMTGTSRRVDMQAVQREVLEKTRDRTVTWVIGTSLLFEAAMLALGCLVFTRRDY